MVMFFWSALMAHLVAWCGNTNPAAHHYLGAKNASCVVDCPPAQVDDENDSCSDQCATRLRARG